MTFASCPCEAFADELVGVAHVDVIREAGDDEHDANGLLFALLAIAALLAVSLCRC